MSRTPMTRKRLDLIILGFVALGAVLRLVFLFSKGTLWLDEAMVAVNFREDLEFLLRGELYYDQRVPFGWLLLHKAVYGLFGFSAVALRAPAFVAGVLALIFLALAVRDLLRPGAAIAVVGVASISPSIVLYSAELKHYSFDMLAGTFFAWLVIVRNQQPIRDRLVLIFNGGSIATALLSLPGVFCVVTAHLFISLSAVNWPARVRRFIALSPWIPVFVLCLLWFATRYPSDISAAYHDHWGAGYMANEPSMRRMAAWPFEWVVGLNELLLGLESAALFATALLAVGIVAWEARFRVLIAALVCVLMLAVLASALSLYPPVARLGLFATPAVLLLTGMGIDWVITHPRRGWLLGYGLTILFCGAATLFAVKYCRMGYIPSDRLGASVGRTEDITEGLRILEDLNQDLELIVLVAKTTAPALAFHSGGGFLPSDRVWFEEKPPFESSVSLRDNRTYSVRFFAQEYPHSFMAPTGEGGQYLPTDSLEEFMDLCAQDGDSVALFVTQSHSLYRHVFLRMKTQYPEPRTIEFRGGIILLYQIVG